MLKALATISLMLLLCSCEIFGWDSSGGADGENPTTGDDFENQIGIASNYYIDIPMAYPNTGSEAPTESTGGPQIQIPDLEEQPRSIIISEQNALALTKAACDQTATSILNINNQEAETTISWQNESMSMGSLSLSKNTTGDPPLKLITCIN